MKRRLISRPSRIGKTRATSSVATWTWTKDGDFPVAWAKNYGKGRVFYSTLGHATESWDTPLIQTMYYEAIKWALGLTDGDATPRPRPLGGGTEKK